VYHKMSDAETIEFASALAAMVCISFPGVLACPSCDSVTQFMKDHSSS
jgi:hypothetical protein